jgi:hypothetical protein
MSKVIRVSLSMDFFADEDLITEGMSEAEMIQYFKETFLEDISDGIIKNYLTTDEVEAEFINE